MQPSDEQQAALCLALNGESFFLTGSAGTGKSYTLEKVIDLMQAKYSGRPGAVAIVAPTGAAALQVGGTTIHSFFGLGRVDKQTAPTTKSWSKVWDTLQVLIIDEISMVADWMLDLLDRMGRKSRPAHRHLPFGGVQLILCGDFLQLPPIGGEYCFKSKAWSTTMGKCIELQFAYRQGSDQEFASLLQQVRLGQVDQTLLGSLNHHHPMPNGGIEQTRLYCKRASVDDENMQELNKLPGDVQVFTAQDSGPAWALEDKKLSSWSNAPTRLSLKINAQVLLLKNLDIPNGLVNGSRGVVVGFSLGHPVVRFLNGTTLTMELAKWTLSRADDSHAIMATRHQYPLDLAWALTIHKSQGMSLDAVYTDLAECFEDGMAYVALSRCKTLGGLTVAGLSAKSIRTNKAAIAFYAEMGQQEGGKRRRVGDE